MVSQGKNSETEHKPNYKNRPSTPQGDFMRQKLSPNAAEGHESLGLKDLAKLVSTKTSEDAREEKHQQETAKKEAPSRPNKNKKGKNNRSKDKKRSNRGKKNASVASPTPVKPEVEYQEKSTATIKPSHAPIDLEKPIQKTDSFAEKDNSVDGFLSVKH